jgi:hypothetical protein
LGASRRQKSEAGRIVTLHVNRIADVGGVDIITGGIGDQRPIKATVVFVQTDRREIAIIVQIARDDKIVWLPEPQGTQKLGLLPYPEGNLE